MAPSGICDRQVHDAPVARHTGRAPGELTIDRERIAARVAAVEALEEHRVLERRRPRRVAAVERGLAFAGVVRGVDRAVRSSGCRRRAPRAGCRAGSAAMDAGGSCRFREANRPLPTECEARTPPSGSGSSAPPQRDARSGRTALHVLPRPVVDPTTRARGPMSSTDSGSWSCTRHDQRGAPVGGEAGVGHRSSFRRGGRDAARASSRQNRTVHPAGVLAVAEVRARARSGARPPRSASPVRLVPQQRVQLARRPPSSRVAQPSPATSAYDAVEASRRARTRRRPARGRRPAAARERSRRPARSNRSRAHRVRAGAESRRRRRRCPGRALARWRTEARTRPLRAGANAPAAPRR